MGTGVVTAGSKAGRATVTATAGGKSASVQVTVEAQDPYAATGRVGEGPRVGPGGRHVRGVDQR